MWRNKSHKGCQPLRVAAFLFLSLLTAFRFFLAFNFTIITLFFSFSCPELDYFAMCVESAFYLCILSCYSAYFTFEQHAHAHGVFYLHQEVLDRSGDVHQRRK